ncbi:MAG: hypothetical protein AB1384_14860 [Actinomycetota bacterium]
MFLSKPVPEELIRRLIEEIAPLNNLYRQAVKEHQPCYVSLGYLWDIGDILLEAGVDQITPLASAIHARSYITAQIVMYSFRIRRYFPQRGTIKRRFGKVTSYAAFRDAFPLLENERYRLSRVKERELVKLLNSGKESREIRREIASLKKARVPERKKRDMRLHELDSFVQVFDEQFGELQALMEKGSRQGITRFARRMGIEVLLFCNRLCLSLADESFAPPEEMPPLDDIDPRWSVFIKGMYEVTSGDRVARNRARRRIKPMHFVTMGSYMDILRDERKIKEYIGKR